MSGERKSTLDPGPLDADTVDLDPAEALDLTTCEREPIHLSGAVQPHGVLLAVEESELRIVSASLNAGEHFGGGKEAALVGSSMQQVLGEGATSRLRLALLEGRTSSIDALSLRVPGAGVYEVTWHRSDAVLIVELEPALAAALTHGSTPVEEVLHVMDALTATDSVLDLCRVAAAQVKRLTGYDRVMVYRFHPDDHGEVVAEEREPQLDPFLGLHYPASDIPTQARKLYLLNRLRVIADVDYEPVGIAPAVTPLTGRPLDLSFAGLRSVSPFHLAYLRNMGVRATLVISLMHGNRLWGMLVCHHETPKRVGAQLRSSCALLGQLFSLLVVAKEDLERRLYGTRLAGVQAGLIEEMTGADDLAASLARAVRPALELVDADGVVARIEGQTATAGRTPPPAAVAALLERLQHEGDGKPFVSEALALEFPELAPFADEASGVVAVALTPGYDDFLLWFRGEVLRSVAWAGDPNQERIFDPGASPTQLTVADLAPRQSFAAWVATVSSHSRPWVAAEVDAAAALGKAVPEILLARARDRLADLSLRALQDPLTGLANRALILGRIDSSLERLNAAEPDVSLLFVDLDRFKEVNDSLGHAAGDALLCEVAERLKGTTRSQDTVARLGGDEFVVLCHGSNAAHTERLAERILACFHAPFSVDGREVAVTASVGIAVAEPGSTAATLLPDSDTALYRVKETGRNSSARFSTEMRAASLQPADLEARLRPALERGDLTLHYQPIVNADGRLTGFEALARWPLPSPERGMVSPAAFIPVAEDTGLIRPLTHWALGEALRNLSRWRLRLPGLELTMSVNVSAHQMGDGLLGISVDRALEACDVPAEALCLEITERVLVGDEAPIRHFLSALRERGVRIAIDDFGTGFSSLAYLTQVPVDQVKIDRTFIAGLPHRHSHTAVVASVVQLGHQLDLEVLAEGIETDEQLAGVLRLGCDLTQGYLLGRPMPAAGADRLCSSLTPAGILAHVGGSRP